jgi:3-deoxy-manno-octulosonate cytidylyltransferase (CMP-KDO synthetase)
VTDITNPVDVIDPTNVKVVFNEQGDGVWASRSPIPYPKGSLDFTYFKTVGVAAFSPKTLQYFHDIPMTLLESIEDLDMYRFLEYGKKVHFRKTSAHSISVDTPKDLEEVRLYLSTKER